MGKIKSTTVKSEKKKNFLKSLAIDLRKIGINARVIMRQDYLIFHALLPDHGNLNAIELMEHTRREQLLASSQFIKRMTTSNLIELFIDGADLNIDNISPRIHICRTEADFAIFRYCRLLQAVPSANRIGRQICALVFDDGQARPILMGAIGLASCMYTVTCRDQYLGWIGKSNTEIKNGGLKQLMDLSMCISVPPYSFLLAGKLMAMFAITNQLRAEFKRKYKLPLLGLTSSCATGIHCPIFNRIMIREGGLYKRIGVTAGYTTSFFSTSTLRAARELVREHYKIREGQLHSKPLQILYRALRICELPYTPLVRLGTAKGVYLASLSRKSITCLRRGRCSRIKEDLSATAAIDFWRTNLLPKRRDNSRILSEIKAFKHESLLLG